MAPWEPGDDICPPWPWWKHWPGPPPPPWWDQRLAKVGEEIYAGLTMVNMARRVSDPQTSLALAKAGSEMISKHGQELQQALSRTRG